MASKAHGVDAQPAFIDANALKRYMDNSLLGKQMGVYFYELCKLREAMGRPHLTKLLNESRQERLDKIKETRHDKRPHRDRKGGRRVRRNGH